jgi:hypothetical protein
MCVEFAPADMDPTKFKVCPLVNNPRRDCYCLDMTSRNIEKVVRYCSGDYEQCAIYIESRQKRPHIS